jgi:tripartite-type tricarboxylate transporter receptor subunit TctC
LRALAVTSANRSSSLPDLPPVADAVPVRAEQKTWADVVRKAGIKPD